MCVRNFGNYIDVDVVESDVFAGVVVVPWLSVSYIHFIPAIESVWACGAGIEAKCTYNNGP